MLLAVRRCLAALDIEGRERLARITRAKPAADVHHAVVSVLPAVHRRLAALGFEEPNRLAGVM